MEHSISKMFCLLPLQCWKRLLIYMNVILFIEMLSQVCIISYLMPIPNYNVCRTHALNLKYKNLENILQIHASDSNSDHKNKKIVYKLADFSLADSIDDAARFPTSGFEFVCELFLLLFLKYHSNFCFKPQYVKRTICYRAPESLPCLNESGKSKGFGEVGCKVDCYALGISLYAMLTASLPRCKHDISPIHMHECESCKFHFVPHQ